MAKPSKPVPGYVSPVVLARAVLARAAAGEHVSKQALSTARRIVALPSWVVPQLERHQAPYRVVRWVAWGKESEMRQRSDLAVLLRSARSSKGWPDVRHLEVAFDVYRETRVGTLVSDVPLERYAAAIDALPKRQRRARTAVSAAEQSTTSLAIESEEDVLRALVAIRRPKRARPPTIKLRTTPVRADDQPTASPAAPLVGIERVVAENVRLHEQHKQDELKAALREVEAERQKELHGREIAELKAKIETLERERSAQARSGGLAPWVVGLGSAAVGAMATEIVRRGVDLLHVADDAQAGAQTVDAAGSLGGEALFLRLLPVFDNVARAQRHAEEGAPSVAVAEGLRVVREQLDQALARSGIERVPTVGQKFDPTRHEAVEHVDAPEPAGVVLREVLPGYTIGGRLLRAPTVIVSKGHAAAPSGAS